MKLGISSGCWYPSLTEDSVVKIKDAGFSAAEIFLCDESETEPLYLKRLKDELDKNEISVISVHPFTSFAEQFVFFSGYKRREESAYKFYRKYHDACHLLGAEIINFHGATSYVEPERYAEVYGRLFHEAKEEGLIFCQENVRKFCSGKVSFLSELKRILEGNIAFTLDVKQALMEGEDLSEMIKVMGEDIRLVHVSDSTEFAPCLLPGFGNFDLERFCKELKCVDYDGYLITEVYSQNYQNESDVNKSQKYFSNILNKI